MLNKACFVAGTPVLLEDDSLESIECLTIGADVRSWTDSVAAHESHDEFPATGPGDWRVYQLAMNDVEDNPVSVALLRPADWLEHTQNALRAAPRADKRAAARQETHAWTGAIVHLELPELGLDGPARVIGVEPCPPQVTVARGGFVSGTIARQADATLRIRVDATHDVIETTASHPFWSATRGGWTRAGNLLVGEALTTHEGATHVTSIDLGPPNTVYNIEVFDDHTYFVGQAQAWVHNSCPIPKFTRAMKARAFRIASGTEIDKVNTLVQKFGGRKGSWRKMKTWTDDNAEIHYYEHHGIGVVGAKWAGDPDPF